MREFRWVLAGLLSLGLLVQVVDARAAEGEDDESFFQSAGRFPADRNRRPNYSGARDDQPLQIQASLPQPTRAADGSSAPGADEDEPQEASPED